eukprot:m51a1_g1795 putative serine threonine kinase (999) ;mRNA; r:413798-418262
MMRCAAGIYCVLAAAGLAGALLPDGGYLGVTDVGVLAWNTVDETSLPLPDNYTASTCWSIPIAFASGGSTTTLGEQTYTRFAISPHGYVVLSGSSDPDPCNGSATMAGSFTSPKYALAFPRTTCAGTAAPLLSVDAFAFPVLLGDPVQISQNSINGAEGIFIKFGAVAMDAAGNLVPKTYVFVSTESVYFGVLKFKSGTAKEFPGFHMGVRGPNATISLLCNETTGDATEGINETNLLPGQSWVYKVLYPTTVEVQKVPIGSIVGGVVGGCGAAVGLVVVAAILSEAWKSFMAQPSDIAIDAEVGRRSDAVTFRATWGGSEALARVFSMTERNNRAYRAYVHETVAEIGNLRHPNIQQFLCFALTPTELTVVYEYMANGTLKEVLALPRRLPVSTRLDILKGVAKGMAFLHLHQPQIIHGSLTSSCILLDSSWSAKVADFGWNRLADDSAVGALLWRAPECLAGGPATTRGDVFSFAIITWEAVSCDTPYGNLNVLCVPQQVMEDSLRPTIDPEAFEGMPSLESMMKRCWDTDPQARPEFGDILAKWDEMLSAMEGSLLANNRDKYPTGRVALVVTDMQGSTRLWEWNENIAKQTLFLHNRIIRKAIRKCHGFEVKTEGDSFLIAFESVADALEFCCQSQVAMMHADWNPKLFELDEFSVVKNQDGVEVFRGVRVRMGIHVGEVETEVAPNGAIQYFGTTVIRTTGISAKGKGGQVVLSNEASIAIAQFVVENLERDWNESTEAPSISISLGNQPVGGATVPDLFAKYLKSGRPTWAVDPQDVTFGNSEVARGNFGAVFQGEWRGQVVAVKKFFQHAETSAAHSFQQQLKEIALLAELRHPSIVLFTVLTQQKIEMPQALEMLQSISQGLIYLQHANITHRDLKASNILVNKKLDIKLAVAWMAPEILTESKYSEMSDVYAYGMVMYEILTRKNPFHNVPALALVSSIIEGKRPELPATLAGFSDGYVALMRQCWDTAPDQRPHFIVITGQIDLLSVM